MKDDEFFQVEIDFREALAQFKNACEENGFDFEERVKDELFDLGVNI